jgi:uncharacterized protein YegL
MPIKNTYIQLNNYPVLPVNPCTDDDETFGIMVLELNAVKITNRPIFILFTVDTTGSMGDCVKHANTKMQYAIQTLKSIMKYVSTQKADIYVQINTFNETIKTIVDPVKVSQHSLPDILETLNAIDADGSTNIEAALTAATASITSYAQTYPNHTCVHIFMTDGEPTCGATSSAELLKCISTDYMSINIGFGTDHNAKLLSELSISKNSEYHFIDKLENASLVYGESLHKVLYPCLQNVHVQVENGLIYDWTTNKWNTGIYESTLIGEIKKYYHVKTKTPCDIIGTIKAEAVRQEEAGIYTAHIEETVLRLPDLVDENDNVVHDDIIIKFAFRQCILEALYEAKHIHYGMSPEELNAKKQQIKDLFDKIQKYVAENNMQSDGIITQLLNDLYLAFWNIGAVDGGMYIFGRHSSQGNQQAHTPGNDQIKFNNMNNALKIPPVPVLRRLNRMNARFDQDSQFDPPGPNLFTTNTLPLNLVWPEEVGCDASEDEYSSYSTPGIRSTTDSIRLYDE